MRSITCLLLVLSLISCQRTSQVEISQYTIEQFYKSTNVLGGSFSPDESGLLFTSNESGIYNLFEVSLFDGEIHQITNSTGESYFAIDYVPETGQILYSADKGGDEISHIYLLNEDGSSLDLTPGAEEKAQFGGWSKDKKYFYYASNRRNPLFMDLYKMKVETWEPEMLFQNDEGLFVVDISYNEDIIALQKNITTSENNLYLLSRSTGEKIEISDPANRGEYYSSGFSNDGKTFFYNTNSDKEFRYLVKYDIESGKHETFFEAEWDVMYSSTSENEKYRIISINEDGKNTLVIKDNSTGEELDFSNLPDGDILAAGFSDSEKLMRLLVGTSKSPTNIYVYNFETEELKKYTETLNIQINSDDLVSSEPIRFMSFDGLEIPAIYYKPINASKNSKAPALVWVHGGPGGQSRTGFNSSIQYLVNHGYAVLAVNNRGSSGYGKTFYRMDDKNHGDKDLKDCIWGKKWLQEQEYIDAERIGIMGGSYGGYMTMAAMTFEPDEFTVGVNLYGVTNWIRTLKSIPPYWEANRRALYDELGDPFTQDSIRLYNISPLFHANKVKNPVMVLQGANDPRVLQIESDEIVEAIRDKGVYVEYLVFPDEGHGFIKKDNQIKAYGQILEFLDTYLKGKVR